MNHSSLLAAYAANLQFSDLPSEVVTQAKQLTLHVLAVSEDLDPEGTLESLPLLEIEEALDCLSVNSFNGFAAVCR